MKNSYSFRANTGRWIWLAVAVLVLTGVSSWAQIPQPSVVPPLERYIPPHPPGTGFIPPAVDLSHLEGQWIVGKPILQPPTFDWRNNGGNFITPVKNQAACGACYAFASLGDFESKILQGGGPTYDLSENHAKECYFTQPSCAGGNDYQMACLFSQTGTQLEANNPYIASPTVCYTGPSYPYQQTLLDWCIISGAFTPPTAVLKNYIMTNGPVYTTLYVGLINPPAPPGTPWYQEFSSYDGSWGLFNNTEAGTVNHAVLIVGWDDNQTYDAMPHDGIPDGTGCWIVKNSWGTGWGGPCGFGATGGYFYYAYGTTAADFGQWSSFLNQWQPYDTNGGILYFDDAGWGNVAWGYGSTTCWALCRYAVAADTQATSIEFWTNDVTTDVDVYLYDSFITGTGTLGTLLASSLNNSFAEAGYHSVSITPTDIGPSSNPEAVAVVAITNSVNTSPIQADWGNGSPPLETQRCYISPSGTTGSWSETSSHGTFPSDLGVRIRTSTSTAVGDWKQY